MKQGKLGKIEIDKVPTKFREKEHQSARYQNMCRVAAEVTALNLEGDVVEFGTWKGVGLLMLADAFQKVSGHEGNRTFFGVDTFKGLPRSSTVWGEGLFSDTDAKTVADFLSSESPADFKLVQGLFEDEAVAKRLHSQVKNCVAVHFDADLGSSTLAALRIAEKWLPEDGKPIFFLFDDWGIHPDEVPEAFNSWIEGLRNQGIPLTYERCYLSRFTRYFKVSLLVG